MIVPLTEVIYDLRARDGTWCQAEYPNHKKGCPNFPKCIHDRPDFKSLNPESLHWYAVVEEFDLAAQAVKMKEKHPKWSERQTRNLLYWQNGVRKRLFIKAMKICVPLVGDVLLSIPEANGVNVFATMAKHGVFLKSNPDQVKKIMLVGKTTSLGELKEA